MPIYSADTRSVTTHSVNASAAATGRFLAVALHILRRRHAATGTVHVLVRLAALTPHLRAPPPVPRLMPYQ